MKNIILLAPPAAGKGTQSILISEYYNIPHISTGDLLRGEIINKGKYSDIVSDLQTKGELVPDYIVLELLKERLKEEDCKNGYILDGFPRNVDQAIVYDNFLKDLNRDLGKVIFLEVDKKEAMKRIVGRVSCPNCGAVFNEMYDEAKPKQEGICDICSSSLVKRKDDNEEVFNKRFETYLEKTKPLIDYYENKKVLYRIQSIDKDTTFEKIKELLND